MLKLIFSTMNILKIITLLSLTFCVYFNTENVEARAFTRRRQINDLELQLDDQDLNREEKDMLGSDVHKLEDAIENEIIDIVEKEEKYGIPPAKVAEIAQKELSAESLDNEVSNHNKNRPWYRRLGNFLKDSFHEFVKVTAQKIINGHVIPAITGAIFGTLGG